MRIHHLQHVPFEGLGSMEPYLKSLGHQLSATHLYQPPFILPTPETPDFLIIMGGPMGIYDEHIHPWLREEKLFIRRVIERGVAVLGVCLGAQLIADCLGAKVFKNAHKEIGWFPIERSTQAEKSKIGLAFPERMEVFHWHGDTFELPGDAVCLASSEACANQAFLVGDRILGLQFHLETTEDSAKALIENCGDEMVTEQYIQTAEQILSDRMKFHKINTLMNEILEILLD